MKKISQKTYVTLSLLGAMVAVPLLGVATVSAADVTGTTIGTQTKANRDTLEHENFKVGSTEMKKDEIGERIFKSKGITGAVTAISGTSITLKNKAGTIYTIDASSATVTKNNVATTFAGIAIGDMLRVKGTVTGTSVVATAIRDGVSHEKGVKPGAIAYKPKVVGTVTSVNGNTLTVTGKDSVLYTVDGTNAKVMKMTLGAKPTIGTVSSIIVGDTVRVQGTLTGTNILATTIFDGVLPQRSLAKHTNTASQKASRE